MGQKITEQQKQEMLEYMGYTPISEPNSKDLILLWKYAKGQRIPYHNLPNLLDLNFLFEVAEKLCFIDVCISKHKDYYVACVGWNEEIEREICADAKDKAEALFLALYQTIKEMK